MASSPLDRLRTRLSHLSDCRLLTGLFVFALVVRLIYLMQIKGTDFFSVVVGDGTVYDAWARQIQSNWLGTEVFYQAPLYPYFLASIYTLFGHDLLVVRVIQMALGAAACVLLARAGSLFFSRNVGILAGFLLALYGPAIFFDGLIQKASLDLFLMTALLFLLGEIESTGRRRWAISAGFVLGCLSLTRENALVLLPLLFLWLVWRFRRVKPSMSFLFFLGIALVLTPVAARNYKIGGEFIVTTSQFGPNFFIGNNAKADGSYRPLRWGNGSALLERKDATEIAEEVAGKRLTPGEVSSFWTQQALGWIRSHPADWLKLMGRKWLLTWNNREVPDSDEPLVYEDASWLLALAGMVFSFGTICPLALAGIAMTWPERRRLVPLYLALIGIAASTALFFVFARYRFPMVPILTLFAAAAVREMCRIAREKRTAKLFAFVMLMVAAGIICRWNLDPEENPRAMAYYNLAVSLERQGHREQAAAYYQDAVECKPEFVQAHVNLGVLLAAAGKLDEAIVHDRAALRTRPDDLAAHCNLANALAAQGKLDEAEKHYRIALRIRPDLPQAQSGLAAVLKRKKKPTVPGHAW